MAVIKVLSRFFAILFKTLTGLFCFIAFSLNSQNILIDGSFEDYKRCPTGINRNPNSYFLKNWSQANSTHPDYFNECSITGYAQIPKNQCGIQEPRSGKGYAGFVTERGWFEYLQGELRIPLNRGVKYEFEFFVSLSEYSCLAMKDLGILFSKEKLKFEGHKPLDFQPFFKTKDVIIDKEDWVKISGEFMAEGGESFIIIGCFGDKKSLTKTQVAAGPREKMAYYYIDDVSITPKYPSERTKDVLYDSVYSNRDLLDVFTMPNITFNADESELQGKSSVYLDSLVKILSSYPYAKLLIEVHTDSIGAEVYNLELSRKRAESIKSALISMGIKEEEIEIKGLGSTVPKTSNDTEEGKAINRRVEVKIYK